MHCFEFRTAEMCCHTKKRQFTLLMSTVGRLEVIEIVYPGFPFRETVMFAATQGLHLPNMLSLQA